MQTTISLAKMLFITCSLLDCYLDFLAIGSLRTDRSSAQIATHYKDLSAEFKISSIEIIPGRVSTWVCLSFRGRFAFYSPAKPLTEMPERSCSCVLEQDTVSVEPL
jgi:hypothetical protein